MKLSGRKTGLAVTVREEGREFDRNLREGGRVYMYVALYLEMVVRCDEGRYFSSTFLFQVRLTHLQFLVHTT